MTDEDELDAELKHLKRPVFKTDEPPDDAVITRALKWSFATIVVMISVAGGIVYYLDQPPPPLTVKITEHEKLETRPAPIIPIPAIPFADVTRAAHIAFVHENGAAGEKLLPESMGGGCAFFDYNNDTFPDILLVNSDVWPEQLAAGEHVTEH